MSTHNIAFNEDNTKIVFQLSSNIIKYTPYHSSVLNGRCTVNDVNFWTSKYVENIKICL